ncbi:hypothetical protein Tco_0761135 [Tanacetum coccineum]
MALPSCLMPMVLISKSTATVLSTYNGGDAQHWLSGPPRLSARITKFRDRVELATRILPTNSLKPLVSGVVSPVSTRASHPLVEFSTDKSKITRKQSKASKHGHENQKSTKRSQRSKAEARKKQASINPKNYITKPSHWPIPIKEAHVDFKEAQGNVGFCTKTLTKEAQMSHQENDTLAILRCPQFDQTATIEAQMIEEMIFQD